MNDRTFPITVTARPSGVALDAKPYLGTVLLDLVDLLRNRPELMEDLDFAVYGDTASDPHLPETCPTEDLLARILEALPEASKEIRVHGPALDRLAGTLTTISRNQGGRTLGSVPAQREGEAAA
jgi:hypothetical protein